MVKEVKQNLPGEEPLDMNGKKQPIAHMSTKQNDSALDLNGTSVAGAIVELSVDPDVLELQRRAKRRALLDAFAFQGPPPLKAEGGWQSTYGMFTDDVTMQEISDETRRLRDSQ